MSDLASVRRRGQGWGVGMFGCDRLAGRPHSQDLGTGREARRHSGLNLNGVQYRLEAGETQGRRTRVEGAAGRKSSQRTFSDSERNRSAA